MGFEAILQQAGIPILVFFVCLYYGLRLLLLQDIDVIRSKNRPPVKEVKAYAKKSGILILFLAAVTLLMAILLFVSVYWAFGEICIGIIIFGILWKKSDSRYSS